MRWRSPTRKRPTSSSTWRPSPGPRASRSAPRWCRSIRTMTRSPPRSRAVPMPKAIRSGGCRSGAPTTRCSIPRSPTSTMSRPGASPARSRPRCSCGASFPPPRPGCIATSMPGTRPPSRGDRRVPNARAPAPSITCSRHAMADAPHRADLIEIIDPLAPMRREPSHDALLETQALKGERVTVEETTPEGWCRGILDADGSAGWLPTNALAAPGPAATHKVAVPRTLAFPGPSIKLPPIEGLWLGCWLAVARIEEPFAVLHSGGYVPARHLALLDAVATDMVAVAEQFLHVPYLWGGKTALGLDC